MRKKILFLFLGISLNTYSQDIDKMDKKELRTALKKSNFDNDSLVSTNTNKDQELILIKRNLIISKDSIKTQNEQINSLLTFKKQHEINYKILSQKINLLSDSLKVLKKKAPSVVTSFSLNTLPKFCSMVYAETKAMYKEKKYICFWGESEGDNALIIYLNEEKIKIERTYSDEETDDYQYRNDNYLVRIRNRKNLYENDIVSIMESAELIITNLSTGQEIIKKIYGEGGC